MLKSNLCDYKDAYILLRSDIAIIGHNVTQVAFKNCSPFIKCTTKIDGTTIDDAEDLDLVMLMNNLLEYSSGYSDMTGSSWFFSIAFFYTNFDAAIGNNDAFKSIKHKAKFLGNAEADGANGILKRIIVFFQHLAQKMLMLILIILFLLSKTQNCMHRSHFITKREVRTVKTF